MADPQPGDAITIEARIQNLEVELIRRRRSEAIKDSIIQEYRDALEAAQFKVAMLNGQLKLSHQPTE